ncbi:MAG: hypothetical protein ACTSRZ_14405 [Promethearchaeota archaeon]
MIEKKEIEKINSIEQQKINEYFEKKSKGIDLFLKDIFVSFGLSNIEAEIYLVSYGMGPVSLKAIHEFFNLDIESLNKHFQNLIEKGLFKKLQLKELIKSYSYSKSLINDIFDQNDEFYIAIQPFNVAKNYIYEKKFSTYKYEQDFKEHSNKLLKNIKNNKKILEDFENFINDLKILNKDLELIITEESMIINDNLEKLQFKDFISTITEFRQKILNLLKNAKQKLDQERIKRLNLLQVQLKTTQSKFEKFSDEMKDEIISVASKLDNLKKKITINIKKLKLGPIEKTIIEMLNRIIYSDLDEIKTALQQEFTKAFRSPLNKIYSTIQESYLNLLVKPLDKLIAEISGPIENLKNESQLFTANLMNSFVKITDIFTQTLHKTENKVDDLSKTILDQIYSPLDLYSKDIMMFFSEINQKLGKNFDDIANFLTSLQSIEQNEFQLEFYADIIKFIHLSRKYSENLIKELIKQAEFYQSQNSFTRTKEILEKAKFYAIETNLLKYIPEIEMRIVALKAKMKNEANNQTPQQKNNAALNENSNKNINTSKGGNL